MAAESEYEYTVGDFKPHRFGLSGDRKKKRSGVVKVKLDLDMSAFNKGIEEAKKQIGTLIEAYKVALELQRKLKEGEE